MAISIFPQSGQPGPNPKAAAPALTLSQEDCQHLLALLQAAQMALSGSDDDRDSFASVQAALDFLQTRVIPAAPPPRPAAGSFSTLSDDQLWQTVSQMVTTANLLQQHLTHSAMEEPTCEEVQIGAQLAGAIGAMGDFALDTKCVGGVGPWLVGRGFDARGADHG